jgi:hypothetical protein
MESFPKVKSVEALSGRWLKVTFDNGLVRYYDCNPLLNRPAFGILKDSAFFRSVRPDAHGY